MTDINGNKLNDQSVLKYIEQVFRNFNINKCSVCIQEGILKIEIFLFLVLTVDRNGLLRRKH